MLLPAHDLPQSHHLTSTYIYGEISSTWRDQQHMAGSAAHGGISSTWWDQQHMVGSAAHGGISSTWQDQQHMVGWCSTHSRGKETSCLYDSRCNEFGCPGWAHTSGGDLRVLGVRSSTSNLRVGYLHWSGLPNQITHHHHTVWKIWVWHWYGRMHKPICPGLWLTVTQITRFACACSYLTD